MSRSTLPFAAVGDMPGVLVDYLDLIGRPLTAVSDLPASPTNAQIATAFNALLAALRAAGKMDT